MFAHIHNFVGIRAKIYWLFFFSSFGAELTTRFYKINKTTVSFQMVSTYHASSLIFCSQKRIEQKYNCFNYQKALKTCEIGSCSESNVTRDASINLYSTCNFNDGFNILFKGLVSACVWYSNNPASYTQARDNCRSKGSYLYSVKSVEKLKIIQDNFLEDLWIGLNDMDKEGQYIWEDDNTVFNMTLKSLLFDASNPNNGHGNEDCINYRPSFKMLNDDNCQKHQAYICERPILG